MNTTKKICLVITQGEIGGAGQYVMSLARKLHQQGFVVTIAHGQKNNDWLTDEAKKATITTQYLSCIKRSINPLYDILGFFQLQSFFKKNNFDVVHLNSNKIGILGSLAAKKAGIKKIIFTVHGWAFDDPRPTWERKLYIALNRFFIRYVDEVIAVSEYAKQSAFSVGIATDNFHVINNGIDFAGREKVMTREHAKKILHNTYAVNVTQYLIGCIANFYPTKGVLYFAKAINEIVLDHPQYHFCLIGNGEQKRQLEQYLHDHSLEKNVTIISNLTDAYRFLPAFDTFVLPSIKECYPYVLLEAMSVGLPIVASHVGGIPEALRHYPDSQYVLVPAKDPTKLAHAIRQAVTTLPLSKEHINELLPHIDSQVMLEKTIEIYNR